MQEDIASRPQAMLCLPVPLFKFLKWCWPKKIYFEWSHHGISRHTFWRIFCEWSYKTTISQKKYCMLCYGFKENQYGERSGFLCYTSRHQFTDHLQGFTKMTTWNNFPNKVALRGISLQLHVIVLQCRRKRRRRLSCQKHHSKPSQHRCTSILSDILSDISSDILCDIFSGSRLRSGSAGGESEGGGGGESNSENLKTLGRQNDKILIMWIPGVMDMLKPFWWSSGTLSFEFLHHRCIPHHIGVSWNRATPSHHPFFHGIFHYKPSILG